MDLDTENVYALCCDRLLAQCDCNYASAQQCLDRFDFVVFASRFKYQPGDAVFPNISVVIPEGTKLVILGTLPESDAVQMCSELGWDVIAMKTILGPAVNWYKATAE